MVDQPRALLVIDFETTFPHKFWVTAWTEAGGRTTRLKLLSARDARAGEVDLVVVHEAADGAKIPLETHRWPADAFDLEAAAVVQRLAEAHGVRFEEQDLAGVRSGAELEEAASRLGWSFEQA